MPDSDSSLDRQDRLSRGKALAFIAAVVVYFGVGLCTSYFFYRYVARLLGLTLTPALFAGAFLLVVLYLSWVQSRRRPGS